MYFYNFTWIKYFELTPFNFRDDNEHSCTFKNEKDLRTFQAIKLTMDYNLILKH